MQIPRLIVTAAVLTDVGLFRNTNEDCVGVLNDPRPGGGVRLAVLADGMGGHAAGEVASRICVDSTTGSIGAQLDNTRPTGALQDAIALANRQVFHSAASADNGHNGMGSTICLLYHDGHSSFYYAWVGDSRIYLLRNGVLTLLTRDDTLVNDMLDQGIITQQQALNHPHSHVVTQAVGTKESVRDIHVEGPLRGQLGDRFLMTSDGVHDFLSQELIAQQLSIVDLHTACLGLIGHAKEAHSTDNLSAIVIEVSSEKPIVANAQSAVTKF